MAEQRDKLTRKVVYVFGNWSDSKSRNRDSGLQEDGTRRHINRSLQDISQDRSSIFCPSTTSVKDRVQSLSNLAQNGTQSVQRKTMVKSSGCVPVPHDEVQKRRPQSLRSLTPVHVHTTLQDRSPGRLRTPEDPVSNLPLSLRSRSAEHVNKIVLDRSQNFFHDSLQDSSQGVTAIDIERFTSSDQISNIPTSENPAKDSSKPIMKYLSLESMKVEIPKAPKSSSYPATAISKDEAKENSRLNFGKIRPHNTHGGLGETAAVDPKDYSSEIDRTAEIAEKNSPKKTLQTATHSEHMPEGYHLTSVKERCKTKTRSFQTPRRCPIGPSMNSKPRGDAETSKNCQKDDFTYIRLEEQQETRSERSKKKSDEPESSTSLSKSTVTRTIKRRTTTCPAKSCQHTGLPRILDESRELVLVLPEIKSTSSKLNHIRPNSSDPAPPELENWSMGKPTQIAENSRLFHFEELNDFKSIKRELYTIDETIELDETSSISVKIVEDRGESVKFGTVAMPFGSRENISKMPSQLESLKTAGKPQMANEVHHNGNEIKYFKSLCEQSDRIMHTSTSISKPTTSMHLGSIARVSSSKSKSSYFVGEPKRIEPDVSSKGSLQIVEPRSFPTKMSPGVTIDHSGLQNWKIESATNGNLLKQSGIGDSNVVSLGSPIAVEVKPIISLASLGQTHSMLGGDKLLPRRDVFFEPRILLYSNNLSVIELEATRNLSANLHPKDLESGRYNLSIPRVETDRLRSLSHESYLKTPQNRRAWLDLIEHKSYNLIINPENVQKQLSRQSRSSSNNDLFLADETRNGKLAENLGSEINRVKNEKSSILKHSKDKLSGNRRRVRFHSIGSNPPHKIYDGKKKLEWFATKFSEMTGKKRNKVNSRDKLDLSDTLKSSRQQAGWGSGFVRQNIDRDIHKKRLRNPSEGNKYNRLIIERETLESKQVQTREQLGSKLLSNGITDGEQADSRQWNKHETSIHNSERSGHDYRGDVKSPELPQKFVRRKGIRGPREKANIDLKSSRTSAQADPNLGLKSLARFSHGVPTDHSNGIMKCEGHQVPNVMNVSRRASNLDKSQYIFDQSHVGDTDGNHQRSGRNFWVDSAIEGIPKIPQPKYSSEERQDHRGRLGKVCECNNLTESIKSIYSKVETNLFGAEVEMTEDKFRPIGQLGRMKKDCEFKFGHFIKKIMPAVRTRERYSKSERLDGSSWPILAWGNDCKKDLSQYSSGEANKVLEPEKPAHEVDESTILPKLSCCGNISEHNLVKENSKILLLDSSRPKQNKKGGSVASALNVDNSSTSVQANSSKLEIWETLPAVVSNALLSDDGRGRRPVWEMVRDVERRLNLGAGCGDGVGRTNFKGLP